MHSFARTRITGQDALDAENQALPSVSVISLARNRRDNVLELMETLHCQDYPNFEVILVDNDSQDGTADVIEKRYPNVNVFRCPQNFGNVSYNFGLANAKGKYILLIDDDGLPASSDWISEVVNRFESNPRLGAVACTIPMRYTGDVAYDSPQFVPEGDLMTGFPSAAYNGTGAGLRTEALRQVGYYPFHFFLSWSELHLCTRLLEAGWQVRCFPSIEVWHSRASNSVNRPLTYYGLRNYLWYVWTFYPWPQVLTETLHFLGSRLKSVIKRQVSVGLFLKAVSDSFIGWTRISTNRRPIAQATLAYLRRVRRYGHDHPDIVPQYRRFSAD